MYAGIDLDYRGINPQLRNDYSVFAAELGQALHENQKLLSIHVSPPLQVAADRWKPARMTGKPWVNLLTA